MRIENDWHLMIWFRLAVLQLHIQPDAFWDMPLRDWLWLCRKSSKVSISEQDLTALMAQFPDEGRDDEHK